MFDASTLISDSRLPFIQGQYEVSLTLAKEVLLKEPKNLDAHQCAGNVYMSKADYK